MNLDFLAALTRALNAYYTGTTDILGTTAYNTAYKGTIAADLSLGVKAGSPYYSQIAEQYSNEYKALLVKQGGSYVFDTKSNSYVFKPWLSEQNEATRTQLADIIKQGIKDGKPLGSKQSSTGTYPKGSIAYDINEAMDGKKSWASTVARTESANITNESRLMQLQNRGVQRVRVWDNEGPKSCGECGRANQQEWDIDYALDHMLAHPNCVRRFQAILKGVRITAKQEELLAYHHMLMKAEVGLVA
jgi:hypothetical protein